MWKPESATLVEEEEWKPKSAVLIEPTPKKEISPKTTPITEALKAVEPSTEDIDPALVSRAGLPAFPDPSAPPEGFVPTMPPQRPVPTVTPSVPQKKQPERADLSVMGIEDVLRGGPELWEGPGAEFTKSFVKGWVRATHIPKLMGKKIPPPKTAAEKIGEYGGMLMESITELIATAGALRAIKALPYGYSLLSRAGQTGTVFAAQQATEEARKATAEALHGEDFGYRGGIAVLESFALGAVLSIAHSGVKGIWSKLKPTEQAKALKVLGLKKGATADEIRKAALKLAPKYHPDKVKGMRDKYDQVMKARETLWKQTGGKDIVYAKEKPTIPARITGRPPTVVAKPPVDRQAAEVAAMDAELAQIQRQPPTEAITPARPTVAAAEQIVIKLKNGQVISGPLDEFTSHSDLAVKKGVDFEQIESSGFIDNKGRLKLDQDVGVIGGKIYTVPKPEAVDEIPPKPTVTAPKVAPVAEGKDITDFSTEEKAWLESHNKKLEKVLVAEKDRQAKLTPEEKALWEKDPEAFSKSKGYTAEEFKDYKEYIKSVEMGEALGFTKDFIHDIDRHGEMIWDMTGRVDLAELESQFRKKPFAPTPSALAKPKLVDLGPAKAPEVKAVKKVPRGKPPAKEKKFEIEPGKFYTQAKIDEAIAKGEMGEIEIEPVMETESKSFNKHIDYFQTRQLPETSQIRKIQKQMQVVNGKRLAGTITAREANKKIQQLKKILFETAQKEGIALRMTKGGKVSVAVRKAGTYVPVEFAEYKKFKDIYPRAQDVTRSIQQIDGALSVKEKEPIKGQAGMAEQHILWPTREIHIQKDRYIKEKAAQLKKILPVKEGSKEDAKINEVLEKIAKADRNKPIKDVLSAKTIKAMGVKPSTVSQAIALRKWFDETLDEQNIARRIRDQEEIPYRHNYSPQILRDATIWERITMTGKTAEDVFGKKAPIPDYIRPNKPFNPREMARKAGIRYEERIKSATELAGRYLSTAAKDIFNTSIIQNNKAFIQQLEAMGYENPARYLADWTSQAYAGIMPSLDRAILLGETPKIRKAMMKWNQVRNLAVFPLNVGWTLGTQIKSFAMTIGRYGSVNVTRGFLQWLKPSIRKQAAEDYYSFIVKSAKQGRVTRQDAKNLIGEEVKLRRTKGELARDLTTLFLEEMEKLLTGASIRAAHLHGAKRGLTGEALKNYASDGGAKTQSMYNDEDKPLFLTNLTVKTVTPYQTYCYETMNTLREWAGRTGTPPDSKMYAVWSLVRYLAAMAVLNQIEASVRGRKWSWLRLVPMPFAELWLSPIYKHFTKEWLPGGSGLLSPIETASRVAKGVDDVLETGSWRKLRNELIKYGPGLFSVPAGVQWARLVDAIITYSQGGVRDRRGKLLFKMKDPQDLARAIFTGVWTTKGGREYIEKRTGKKPEGKRKKRMEREKRMLRK